MPKVSIIVPVYNVEEHLEKCLNSLVNQTLDDIEIIVVNDGSTDGSQIIINKFQENFTAKILSFWKENGGLSDARNFGLEQATGDYIAFVDSDDYVTPQMFAEMYSLAVKHSAEIVICNLEKVDEKGKILQKLKQVPNFPEVINLRENFSVFADLSYFACNKLFFKDLFEGMRFKKNMHFEDIELIPQLLLKCEILAHTQAYHYKYLERENSISKTHTDKGLDILRAVKSVEEAFLKSQYFSKTFEIKRFFIFEGVYSFLAYFAFVKDEQISAVLYKDFQVFKEENKIKLREILSYKRFGKNYLLSLPRKKIVYYLFCFCGMQKWIRKMI